MLVRFALEDSCELFYFDTNSEEYQERYNSAGGFIAALVIDGLLRVRKAGYKPFETPITSLSDSQIYVLRLDNLTKPLKPNHTPNVSWFDGLTNRLTNMFKIKYRIVNDEFSGYEVQYKHSIFPWKQHRGADGSNINTHSTYLNAVAFIMSNATPKFKKNKIIDATKKDRVTSSTIELFNDNWVVNDEMRELLHDGLIVKPTYEIPKIIKTP